MAFTKLLVAGIPWMIDGQVNMILLLATIEIYANFHAAGEAGHE